MNRCLLSASLLMSLAASLPFSAGCGSLDSHTNSDPALATIQGQLVNPSSVAVTGSVRVAVVWESPDGFNVAQDLPVQPVFPSSFTIQLDAPPPASAMVDAAGVFGSATPTTPTGANGGTPTTSGPGVPEAGADISMKGERVVETSGSPSAEVAIGAVVAYLDENGNGKLDLVPTGASGYVDQILATNVEELVVYFQGSVPADAVDDKGNLPSLGYDLHSGCDVALPYSASPGSICTTPPDAGPPQPTCYEEWQSIATPITLQVSSDPQVNSLMCQTTPGGSETVGATQPLPGRPTTYPNPCDPNLGCAPDGSSYTYGSCQTVATGICEGTQENCTSVSYSRPSPVPSDWPCLAN